MFDKEDIDLPQIESELQLEDIKAIEENESDESSSIESDDSEVPDLRQSFLILKNVFEMYLRNEFQEAIDLTDKYANQEMIHCGTKALLIGLGMILSWDVNDVKMVRKCVLKTMSLAQKSRRSGFIDSINKIFWTPDYNTYSDSEVFAELIYCLCLAGISAIDLIQHQTIINVIKGALRLRTAFYSLKMCVEVFKTKTDWETEEARINFSCGLKIIHGCSHLAISHCPQILSKLIEIIGLKASREKGLQELYEASQESNSFYSSIARIFIVVYHTYIQPIIEFGPVDLTISQKIVDEGLQNSPNGTWYLLLKAKMTQLRGNLHQAKYLFNKTIESQSVYKQLHYACYWDLFWCHAMLCEWEEAAHYMQILREECLWSPAVFTYYEAISLYMKYLDDESNIQLKYKISENLKAVPGLTVRYIGRRIMMEKLAAENSIRFFQQNEKIAVPCLELFYHWNRFSIIKDKEEVFESLRKLVKESLQNKSYSNEDELAYLLFYDGIFHKLKGNLMLAEENFMKIFSLDEEFGLRQEYGILPQTCLELGLLSIELGNCDDAQHWIHMALNEYSGYWAQIMVEVRAKSALKLVNDHQEVTRL